jgi:hypothetical protein
LLNISKSLKDWNKKPQEIFYLLNVLIKDERDSSLNQEEKMIIHKILVENLENPCLVWNSIESISEQKNLIKQIEEFLNFFEGSNKRESFEKFTTLNLSLIPLLKKSLEFHQQQIEILKTKESKIYSKSILNLTDIELLTYENKEELLYELCVHFNLNNFIASIKENTILKQIDFSPKLFQNKCNHHTNISSKKDNNNSCILFEILIENLFFSNLPKLILSLIELMNSTENGKWQELSNRALSWLNNLNLSNLSKDQSETISKLNIWSKNYLKSVQIYLDIGLI